MKKVTIEHIEELPQKMKFFGSMLVTLLLFGTFSFMVVKQQPFLNGLYDTIETLALVYHPEGLADKVLQLFLQVIGSFALWWILWSIFDVIFTESFIEYMHVRDLEGRLKHMKNHYIIAGGGRVGEEVAKRLEERKHKYVIVEQDLKRIKELRKLKKPVLYGDASDFEVLKKAHIEHAKTILLTLPQAEKNLLVALLAKEHNPQITIHARADSDDYVSVLKKAGVSLIVIPEIACVDLLMKHVE
jgi:voltage-gated potassium channel